MMECLELFLWNLLLGEKNELRNRTMHINGKFFVAEETNIGFGKADIGTEKAEIDKWRVDMLPDISDKTVGISRSYLRNMEQKRSLAEPV